MGKEKAFKRKRGKREERARFLIYTEGDVTEVLYVKGVRSDLGRGGPNIVLGPTHGDPLGLVRDAIKHRDRERWQGDSFDQVWCVFDVECPTPHASFHDAVALAATNDIFCGITNPCFELWLILHFSDQRAWLTTAAACRHPALSSCSYDPRSKSFNYETCRGLYEDAHARASALSTPCSASTPAHARNPWMSVHELFQILKQSAIR
jgi:hypothetical protein